MRHKEPLVAALWDLRSQYEDGLRALTGAQRALQSWLPGASTDEDKRALKRMHKCFSTLEDDSEVVATILKDANTELEKWARRLMPRK